MAVMLIMKLLALYRARRCIPIFTRPRLRWWIFLF